MSISLTLDTKNITPLTLDVRAVSPTWDQRTNTWNNAIDTWNNPATLLTLDTKNTITLRLDNRN